ncbi:type I secretion system permease/ATPase [Vreelandella venusta]|uniref:Type I secretion system permease/ATPase n=1 Tax=Vreelandella venusta TaxID=44935 RepID=A0ABX2B7U0_9GAMM|nr:type I secretion system permease/ATPase [Halomonas venusta]AZM96725.1 type I secretion system permease/ATPase [Halomonas venusta]NPT29949.1 type I secretion system permease/ATPase [Halomonas venusta]UQI39467.1 type I secretion system permease/ATPase [Halomonas venusta]WAM47533.1 type I secretion system permease/ATPase [Halomonas venusta]WAM51026.1 type I secretion system permease/ATPase [Halomonas venusta]
MTQRKLEVSRTDRSSDQEEHDELLECLKTVASYYQHEVSSEALKAGLPLEQGKLIPSVFGRAASRAGLTAHIVKSKLSGLNPALFPAILLLEPGRACVLLGLDLKQQKAKVIFPELSEADTEISLEELHAGYSGEAIYIRPKFRVDNTSEPSVKKRRDQHWFWGVIRENRRLYRDIVLGSVAINLFALAMPLFVLNVYDRVVPNQATETLWVLAIGIFIVLCFDLALRLMRSSFVDLAASRADVKLSSSIMAKTLGLRLEERPVSTGSFTSTLQSFESIRAFIGSATILGIVDLPFVILFAAIIALINPWLVLPVLVGIVFVLLYALAAQGKLHELSQTTWEVGAQRNALLVESVSQLENVKALRAESRIQRHWEKASAFLSRTGAQLKMVSSSVSSVAQWAQHSVAVCVIIIGVYQIIEGNLTQGGLIAAYMLSSRAMAPVSQAAALLAQYHQSSTALESLNDVMAKNVERHEGKAYVEKPNFTGSIRLEKVTLRYPDEEREALRDVSLSIKAGEKVALLGRIGCGKSSLNKLVLGFYRPTSGAVLVDGVDIRQLDPLQLRRHIGYVPQDVSLFAGTLRDNIVAGGGNDRVDDEALLRAIEIAGLDSLVNSHPRGVDLEVGERGQALSGGQKQAVAIARAVVQDPPILLLDEPTSSMDNASEEAFKANLTNVAPGKTILVVTHRTSLLSLVDRIIVMDAGKVVADGPRDTVVEALRKGQIGRAS